MFAHVCKESEWEQIGTYQILFVSLFLKAILTFLKLIIRESTRFNTKDIIYERIQGISIVSFQIVQKIERKEL